jgi:hypothetical protein
VQVAVAVAVVHQMVEKAGLVEQVGQVVLVEQVEQVALVREAALAVLQAVLPSSGKMQVMLRQELRGLKTFSFYYLLFFNNRIIKHILVKSQD